MIPHRKEHSLVTKKMTHESRWLVITVDCFCSLYIHDDCRFYNGLRRLIDDQVLSGWWFLSSTAPSVQLTSWLFSHTWKTSVIIGTLTAFDTFKDPFFPLSRSQTFVYCLRQADSMLIKCFHRRFLIRIIKTIHYETHL